MSQWSEVFADGQAHPEPFAAHRPPRGGEPLRGGAAVRHDRLSTISRPPWIPVALFQSVK